jgi:glycosyltransferase involved in cell wall biosynthesis
MTSRGRLGARESGGMNGSHRLGVRETSATNGSHRRRLLVSVVMPTLSEADNLPHVIPKLPDWIHELIVVDGYSDDDTVEVARSLWPEVRVVYQTAPGKGNALASGLAACRGDVAVLLDSDGSTDPTEIPRFLDAIYAGADFVKGSRFLPDGSSDDITWLRQAGNLALTSLVNLFFGTRYTDLCYGYNAFRLECLDRLSLDVDGFEVETLMNIRAARAGLKVVEVPSTEGRRLHGTSKLRTFPDGWRVLKTIFREWRLHRSTGATVIEIKPSAEVLARGMADEELMGALSERSRLGRFVEAAGITPFEHDDSEDAPSARAATELS